MLCSKSLGLWCDAVKLIELVLVGGTLGGLVARRDILESNARQSQHPTKLCINSLGLWCSASKLVVVELEFVGGTLGALVARRGSL